MSNLRILGFFLSIAQLTFASTHVVEIDPSEMEIHIVQADNNLETTSSMAIRSGASIAINGGFYKKEPYLGAPSGIVKIDGIEYSPTDRCRGAIGFSNDEALIDRLDGNEPLLTPENASLWESFPNILGATPVLIHRGEKVANFFEESLPLSFVHERFARSCIGILPNQHWLLVFVEEPGMTLYELQDYMYELGVLEALNLSGGNSATLYQDGKMVHSNENKIERPVANALVFTSKKLLLDPL